MILVLFLSTISTFMITPVSAQYRVVFDEYNADETFNAGGAYLDETYYAIKYVPSLTCILKRVEFMTGGAPGGTWYMYLLESNPYVLTGDWPINLVFEDHSYLAGCTFIQEYSDYGWNGGDFHQPVQVQEGATYWIAFFPARGSYPAIADPSSTTAVDYTYIVGIVSGAEVSWGLRWLDGGYEGADFDELPWMMKFYTETECVIATATFGSELSPEVQFLRDFREKSMLTTFTGKQFLNVFNNVYYSFSPAVASAIASNEEVRSISRLVLYPLMGILHLGVEAYSLLSFSPELGIIIFCLIVSALVGIVYLLPLVLFLDFLAKRFLYRGKANPVDFMWFGSFAGLFTFISIFSKKIRLLSLAWLGSIALLSVGWIAKSSLLVMGAGVFFVLTTTFLASLVTFKAIKKMNSLKKHYV